MNVSLSYPATIKFDGEAYQIFLNDIENAFTYGSTLEEAIFNAQDMLGEMLKSYIKDGEDLPNTSPLNENHISISPFPEIAAPIELYLLRKQKGKTI